MHPGFMGWLRRQHAEYHASGHGPSGHGIHAEHPRAEWAGRCGGGRHGWRHASHGFDDHGAGFGVRRPLRFLAHKLELSDDQVAQLAAILDRLKTERAQADVDYRRRTAALAEAFEGASLDLAKLDAANEEQSKSAERLRLSIKAALTEMHALLDTEQRKKLAYLLRAGVLAI